MKTVILEQADLIRSVADEICDILYEKPDAAFTIAGGRTMMPLWRELSVRTHSGKISFAEAKFFQRRTSAPKRASGWMEPVRRPATMSSLQRAVWTLQCLASETTPTSG